MRFPLWRRRRDEDLNEEINTHFEMATRDRIDRGQSTEQAQTEARRELGNVALVKEVTRAMWGLTLIEQIVQDIRYGFRVLRKSPIFTAVAIMTLALGIGANTAIFTFVNVLIFRPLAISDPDNLLSVVSINDQGPSLGIFSFPNYRDLRDRNDVTSGLAAKSFVPMSITFGSETERVIGNLVTSNYFDVLGVKPMIGRTFRPEEDVAPGAFPVVIISYPCWRNRFGGDPKIAGRTVVVNRQDFTIVGVMPRGFTGTEVAFAPEFWAPSALESRFILDDGTLDFRDHAKWFLAGRLKPGVTVAHAQASFNSLAAQLSQEYPNDNEGLKIELSHPRFVIPAATGPVFGFAGMMVVTVGLVLLISCANLAGLLLARATERQREIAVRLALGANRQRLVRQLLTESVLLSVSGGALGLLLTVWFMGFVSSFMPMLQFSITFDLKPDNRILGFTLIVSLLTGVLFGLAPALQATKADLVPSLKGESAVSGYTGSRLRHGFIIAQIALSFVLLIAAGLVIRGLQHAQAIGPGFDTEHAVVLSVDLAGQDYGEVKGQDFYRQMAAKVQSLPGVRSVSMTSYLPLSLDYYGEGVYVEGRQAQRGARVPEAMKSLIGLNYFSTMGIRFVAGRDFTENDTKDSPLVAIVNETFARTFWPGQNALGKRFAYAVGGPMTEVVGVVKDSKSFHLNEDPRPFIYRPLRQYYHGEATLIVRTANDPGAMKASIRNEVRRLDPNVAIFDLKTLDDHMSISMLPLRVGANGVGTFGLLALILATIGIYGGVAFAVSQRTKEIGIRIALGASHGDIFTMIVKQGMSVAGLGLLIGLIASLGLSRLMSSFIYSISATDLITFVAVPLLLFIVVLVACCVPARRATKVDPMTALRYE